jgi:hypothetical protein
MYADAALNSGIAEWFATCGRIDVKESDFLEGGPPLRRSYAPRRRIS